MEFVYGLLKSSSPNNLLLSIKLFINIEYECISLKNNNSHKLVPWVVVRHGTLDMQTNLNQITDNYLELLPKYNGEKNITIEVHLTTFHDFTDNFLVEHEGIFKMLFVQTMEGDVRKWLRVLPTSTIDTW